MNYKRIVEIPEHITSSFFELPCINRAEKLVSNQIIYALHEVKNRKSGTYRDFLSSTRDGALAEDYKGQWWYLTKEEFEDYVEECGLARESQMP